MFNLLFNLFEVLDDVFWVFLLDYEAELGIQIIQILDDFVLSLSLFDLAVDQDSCHHLIVELVFLPQKSYFCELLQLGSQGGTFFVPVVF